MEEQYRVFISYAHTESEYAQHIRDVLKSNNVVPLCDEHIKPGQKFKEEIQRLIAHAHVFLPVISSAASKRGWVHQEIGYAVALNVPVLPVAVGKLSDRMLEQLSMLQQLHVIKYSEDERKLKKRLSYETVNGLVGLSRDPKKALYECATRPEDRALMFKDHADELTKRGFYGMVRQRGGLSSFHIPKRDTTHKIWAERYGDVDVNTFHCDCLRGERLALEKHAQEVGCRLVVDPSQEYQRYGQRARLMRLNELKKFLNKMPSNKVQVTIDDDMRREESLTIVGDWFLAESVSALKGEGYRQTIFTRHAPSILRRAEEFDHEFEELLDELGWKAESSRESAIKVLQDTIDMVRVQQPAAVDAAE